jgi:hypothetical protein
VGGDGTLGSAGSVTTVVDSVATRDGSDTLRNIERLQFADDATPGAPTGVSATGGAGSATVNWVAPVLNKAPQVVTGFSVQVLNAVTGAVVGGLLPADAAATSLVVNGLAPGSYQFRVRAANAAAPVPDGPFSVASKAVTVTAPAAPVVPAAPSIGTATAAPNSATVTFTAPANTGGSPITGFTIDVITGTTVVNTVTGIPASATSAVITGLTNGTSYKFVVHAVNAVGAGVGSAESNLVTPAPAVTAPTAPSIGSAVAGNGQASVSWTAPASDGGSAVTEFLVRTVLNGTNVQAGALQSVPAGSSSAVITGLANGSSFQFQVQAVNAVGSGAFSALSNPVTPATIAGPPTIGTASSTSAGQATVRWTAPASNGGSAITGYQVQVLNAANAQQGALRSAPAGATSLVVTGLTNGAPVTFKVQAVNGVGSSVPSTASNPVTPDGTAPTVTARTPAVNAVVQSQLTNVTATFSEAVQPATITTATFTLRAGAAAPVPATVTYDPATRVATLNPAATLAAGTRYTATLAAGVRDVSGNALVATSWSFSTGPAVVITGRNPAANAVNVSRLTDAVFGTNRPLIGFNNTRVRLVRVSNGANIAGTVVRSATGAIHFNPTATLAAGVQYRVVISAGMTDAAGNPLAPTSWVFTTGLL